MTVTIDAHGRKLEVKIYPSKVLARYEGDEQWTKINDPATVKKAMAKAKGEGDERS